MSKKRTARISTFGSHVTSVISVALVLLILGALAMVLVGSHRLGEQVKANMGYIVKMVPGATDAQIMAMKKRMGAPHVDRFVFASPDDILAEESEATGEDLAALVDENPYGAEFDVKVRPDWASADSITALAARLGQLEGVEEIVTETAVIDSVNSVLRRLSWALLAVAVALLVISLVLINNTVSLAVYSRRFIIHTMKLVGATGAYIRRPFVLAGITTGLVASLIAIALLAVLRGYLASLDASVGPLLQWSAMIWIFAGMLAAGICICAAASVFATNRYLRAGYDQMFKK